MQKHSTPLRGIHKRQLGTGRRVAVPGHKSFEDFLLADARVPSGQGLYGPYSFAGREALLHVVRAVDDIFRDKQTDAEVSLAGGAQFGKTILELNLAAYVTGQQFRNFGLYLPDYRKLIVL